MFGAPEWLPRTIVVLLAIGFVPAVIFSWVFELTPQGLKREDDVAPEKSIAPRTGRRMDRMIIVVLVLARRSALRKNRRVTCAERECREFKEVNFKSFFAELKRRNVYKVADGYAVVGWLLVQITTQGFQQLLMLSEYVGL